VDSRKFNDAQERCGESVDAVSEALDAMGAIVNEFSGDVPAPVKRLRDLAIRLANENAELKEQLDTWEVAAIAFNIDSAEKLFSYLAKWANVSSLAIARFVPIGKTQSIGAVDFMRAFNRYMDRQDAWLDAAWTIKASTPNELRAKLRDILAANKRNGDVT